MTGKNHVERSFRLWFDDASGPTARDLSGDLVPGSVTGGGLTFDRVDMTGVSNGVKNFLAGHPSSEISAQFIMNDTATTGSLTVLASQDGVNGAAGANTLTLQWGQSSAAPVTSDPEWEGEYILMTLTAGVSGGKAILNATWVPVTGTVPAWGTYST